MEATAWTSGVRPRAPLLRPHSSVGNEGLEKIQMQLSRFFCYALFVVLSVVFAHFLWRNFIGFLYLALFYPWLLRLGGGDNPTGPMPVGDAQTLPPDIIQGTSDELDSGTYSSEETIGNTGCPLIIRIRATHAASRMRNIPIGFYVAVRSETGTQQTSSKPALLCKDTVEWDEEIPLPSEPLAKISLLLYASFELGERLGAGELLHQVDITVGQLLAHNKHMKFVKFLRQEVGNTLVSRFSFEIEVDQRVHSHNEHVAPSNPTVSEGVRLLAESTDAGHDALTRYREHREQGDLDEAIKHFEHARTLSELDRPSHAAVLFNLAIAKLMLCQVNNSTPDLDGSIDLLRAVLRLRPRGHPDHPSTLLSLGVALKARFQRKNNESDAVEGNAVLSDVLDASLADSYAYHVAVLALNCTAPGNLIRVKTSGNSEEGPGDHGPQRLDTTFQRLFVPDSPRHALLDHLGILFCMSLSSIGDLPDPGMAVSMLEAMVVAASENHLGKPFWLADLGKLLLTRYRHFGRAQDLEKSILMMEEALELTADEDPRKPERRRVLYDALMTRYQLFGDSADLDKSVTTLLQ